jgi:hypothetical protein
MSYYERAREERRQRLSQEASAMTTAQLRSALEWQIALEDHSAEIGESWHGAALKIEMIRQELARRY